MSAALRCLIEKWAVPFMGVKHIVSNCREDNQGSGRVLEKCRFVRTGVAEKIVELPVEKLPPGWDVQVRRVFFVFSCSCYLQKNGNAMSLRVYEWNFDMSAGSRIFRDVSLM
jgi:hypothetical protein